MPTRKKTTTKKADKPVKKVIAKKATSKKNSTIKDNFQNVRSGIGSSHIASYLHKVKGVKRGYYLVAVVIVILAVALYLGWSYLFVAQVNGQLIPRYKVTSELESLYGSAALNQQIDNTLMLQEAKKRNITVSDAEINSQLDKIKATLSKQGATLDQYLASQNLTLAEAKDRVRLQLLENKILGNVEVTNADIDSYIKTNNVTIPADASSASQLKNSIKNQLLQQKMLAKYQSVVASLRQKANIKLFVNYPPAQQTGY